MRKSKTDIDMEYTAEFGRIREKIINDTLGCIATSIVRLLNDDDGIHQDMIKKRAILGWIKSRESYIFKRSLEEVILHNLFEFAKYVEKENT